jgi:hypothetical protein
MGKWQITGSNVVLRSDSTITWRTTNDHEYFALQRKGKAGEVLLFSPDNLAYVEDHAHDPPDDPEFMFLINTMPRASRYSASKGSEAKAALLHEPWNPEFFTSK